MTGVGFMAVELTMRMWVKERVDWQDRTWRLLENKGQLEYDNFSTKGAFAGGAVVAWRQGLKDASW